MRKIRSITKRHIGKFLKFHYDNGTRTYEYIREIDNTLYPSYSYIGYFAAGINVGEFYESVGASARPSVGYWLPVSKLEIVIVAPELLERVEKWKQK
jgi:hypothetical protein